jgi:hypothetical protein
MRPQAAPVLAMLLVVAASASADPVQCADETPNLLPSVPYSAIRRLEAENKKSGRHGWMEVRTTLDSSGVLRVTVLSEGGSEQIRNRVLRAALKAEQETVARRHQSRSPSVGAYECTEAEIDRSGLLRLPLRPKEKQRHLVVGDLFMQPATRDVVSVKGRLARNPSFWISRVDVEWTYRRVHKTQVLPVSLESIASVKMFGPSTFRMTYDYESVDGEPILRRTRVSH